MRASSAIPGVFQPAVIDNEEYVDGGTVSPVPVRFARELGADVVVYSATKHIDGSGRVLGGAILGESAFLEESYKDLLRHTGPALSPFSAWVLLKGMETLGIRMQAQSERALALVQRARPRGSSRNRNSPLRRSRRPA
mgnify:CR=1 FL=1